MPHFPTWCRLNLLLQTLLCYQDLSGKSKDAGRDTCVFVPLALQSQQLIQKDETALDQSGTKSFSRIAKRERKKHICNDFFYLWDFFQSYFLVTLCVTFSSCFLTCFCPSCFSMSMWIFLTCVLLPCSIKGPFLPLLGSDTCLLSVGLFFAVWTAPHLFVNLRFVFSKSSLHISSLSFGYCLIMRSLWLSFLQINGYLHPIPPNWLHLVPTSNIPTWPT